MYCTVLLPKREVPVHDAKYMNKIVLCTQALVFFQKTTPPPYLSPVEHQLNAVHMNIPGSTCNQYVGCDLKREITDVRYRYNTCLVWHRSHADHLHHPRTAKFW